MDRAVSCSYSKIVDDDDGFSRSETFFLHKGDLQMNEEMQKQLQEFFGEDVEVDFEKAEESDVITKALATVNEYKKDMPDDLKKAVGAIAKQAGFCDTIITKMTEKKKSKDDDGETDLEKAGAKLSKDTLKKITEALSALKSLIPELKVDKANDGKKSEIEKTLEGITKAVEELEKNSKDASDDGLKKLLAVIIKRIETVEKGTGIQKSIVGQEDDSDNTDTGDVKWPSFSG